MHYSSSSTTTLRISWLAVAVACSPGGGTEDGTTAGSTTADESTGASTTEPTTSGPTTTPTGSTDPTVATADSSDDAGMCTAPPVDEQRLDQLVISAPGLANSIRVGEATPLSLLWIDNGFPTAVEACVEWSIAPVDGVTIAQDGLLTVDAAVPAGTIVSIVADIEAGRRVLMADFAVYVPLESPILGNWTELQQLPCAGGAAFTPDPILGELVFRDTGEFTVTWSPFEIYTDYGGTFTYDEGTGTLVLTVLGGNYVPDDIDGEGTASVVDGQLGLEDIWLGVAQEPVTAPACGHVFE